MEHLVIGSRIAAMSTWLSGAPLSGGAARWIGAGGKRPASPTGAGAGALLQAASSSTSGIQRWQGTGIGPRRFMGDRL